MHAHTQQRCAGARKRPHHTPSVQASGLQTSRAHTEASSQWCLNSGPGSLICLPTPTRVRTSLISHSEMLPTHTEGGPPLGILVPQSLLVRGPQERTPHSSPILDFTHIDTILFGHFSRSFLHLANQFN